MPAVYQGTRFHSGATPIPNLRNPSGITDERQQGKLALLNELNREHALERTAQTELEARIRNYELAFRMQAIAPEVVDLSKETFATEQLYGLDQKETAPFGRNCLLARRMVERGVRFVQLYHGSGSKWDAHKGIEKNHTELCLQMDKPVAGLLIDLEQRGLLEETLVVWGGEFGRTPMSEQGNGRDHNPTGFTMWMAEQGLPEAGSLVRPMNSVCELSRIGCTYTIFMQRFSICWGWDIWILSTHSRADLNGQPSTRACPAGLFLVENALLLKHQQYANSYGFIAVPHQEQVGYQAAVLPVGR